MDSPGMSANLKVLFLKLLLLLFVVEVLIRIWSCLDPHWYRQAVRDAGKRPIRYVFIGSSRVACSVVPKEFARAVGAPAESVVNLGAGYSTLIQHYLGLKRMAAALPDGLRGVTVFLEAPEEVPDLATWRDSWVYPQSPDLLINVLSLGDVPRFWTESDAGFGQKLSITAAVVSEAAARQGSGRILMAWLKNNMPFNRSAAGTNGTDLADAGGIRTDEEGVRNARRLALELAAEHLAKERLFPRSAADDTVLKSLNEMLASAGGRLVLYRMPVSSLQKQFYTTAIGRENSAVARIFWEGWAIPMLVPGISTQDEDFLDYWHLRKSRSAEFTRSLADAYSGLGEAY